MISKIISLIIGLIITIVYAYNLRLRNTIILNSKRMKRLNKDIVKVDNRCFRIPEKIENNEHGQEQDF